MTNPMCQSYAANRVAKGTVCSATGLRGCVVRFDPETFADVQKRAKIMNTSFAEQVRCLVEYGIWSVQEAKD